MLFQKNAKNVISAQVRQRQVAQVIMSTHVDKGLDSIRLGRTHFSLIGPSALAREQVRVAAL